MVCWEEGRSVHRRGARIGEGRGAEEGGGAWKETGNAAESVSGVLHTFGVSLCLVQGLVSLSLANHFIVTVPRQVGNLDKLRTLVVAHNRLACLPAEIGNLKSITHLDLSFNRIGFLPENVGRLTQLLTLRLAYNSLGAPGWLEVACESGPRRGGPLPYAMKRLGKLRELTLEENPLLNEPPPDVIQTSAQAVVNYLILLI